MSLTAKQEAFAQGIAKGLGQADAYRAAYDCEKMSDNSIYPNAGKLMANTKIALRIDELKKVIQNKQLWSREMSVKALIQAYKEGTGSVKVSAVRELNLMHGFNAATGVNLSGAIKFELSLPFINQAMVDRNK